MMNIITPNILPNALIFDMDGTLFRTETLIVPAYERTFERLKEEGRFEGDKPPISIILGALGMLLKDIWVRVLPDADEDTRNRADVLLLEEQLSMLRLGVGELYPNVEGTLRKLRASGFRLFVASNGLEAYVRGVAEAKGISDMFEGLFSAGEYRTASKIDLVRLLLERHRVRSAWMIGDRSSDVEAGKGNGLPVIGCQYAAFGVASSELEGSDVLIGSFDELLTLLKVQ